MRSGRIGTLVGDEGTAQLHRPPPTPGIARRARPAGREPALVVGPTHAGPVRVDRPTGVGRGRARPEACPRRGVGRNGSTSSPTMPTSSTGSPRPPPPSTPTSTLPRWFQQQASGHRADGRSTEASSPTSLPSSASPRRVPQYSGGLGHARRRPPEGGLRPRRAARRDRPLLPPRLLPPVADRSTAGSRSASPTSIPHAMAIELCDGVRIVARTRRARRSAPRCGRRRSAARRCTSSTPTSPRTPTELQLVTDRLYGGDVEHRLRQEILLGIGGVRALEALGIPVQVFHTNEGHAGFLGLERIRRHMARRRAVVRRGRRGGARRMRCSPPTRRCRPASTGSRAS